VPKQNQERTGEERRGEERKTGSVSYLHITAFII